MVDRCYKCNNLTTDLLDSKGVRKGCRGGVDYGRIFEFKEHHRKALDAEYAKVGAETIGEQLVWLKTVTGLTFSSTKTIERHRKSLEYTYARDHLSWDALTEEEK